MPQRLHSSKFPATRRPLCIGGLIYTYMETAPNRRKGASFLSLSAPQFLLSHSCVSGQLSATLWPLPATGSARLLVRKKPGPLSLLCVWQRLEGSFLRALCLRESEQDLCAAEPLQSPFPSPSTLASSAEAMFTSLLAPS
jgi:hypothetical protein